VQANKEDMHKEFCYRNLSESGRLKRSTWSWRMPLRWILERYILRLSC